MREYASSGDQPHPALFSSWHHHRLLSMKMRGFMLPSPYRNTNTSACRNCSGRRRTCSCLHEVRARQIPQSSSNYSHSRASVADGREATDCRNPCRPKAGRRSSRQFHRRILRTDVLVRIQPYIKADLFRRRRRQSQASVADSTMRRVAQDESATAVRATGGDRHSGASSSGRRRSFSACFSSCADCIASA